MPHRLLSPFRFQADCFWTVRIKFMSNLKKVLPAHARTLSHYLFVKVHFNHLTHFCTSQETRKERNAAVLITPSATKDK